MQEQSSPFRNQKLMMMLSQISLKTTIFHWTSCIPVWSTLAPNTKRWSRSITTRSIRHIRLIRSTHTLIVQTFTLRLIKKMISDWKAPQKKTAGNRSSVWACSWMPTRSLSVWKCILGMKVKNPLYATSLMILKNAVTYPAERSRSRIRDLTALITSHMHWKLVMDTSSPNL